MLGLVALGSLALGLGVVMIGWRSMRRPVTGGGALSRPTRRAAVAGAPRLSVVVPAYREGGRIADTVRRLRRDVGLPAEDIELVVVVDGPDAATVTGARAAGADSVIEFTRNRGKGAAVRAGVMATTGRTVAFTDADLAYPPRQLAALTQEIEAGWDIAIGSRHHAESRTITAASRLRSVGSRVVNEATRVLLRSDYRDTQCGCKAFRGDVARLVFAAGEIDGFAFDIEVLHLAEYWGLSLTEVPVEVVNDETSTVSAVRDGIRVVADILRIRRAARRGGYRALEPGALPPPAGAPVTAAH